MAQKGLWIFITTKMLEDRGVLPSEDRDFFQEYQAVHEEKSPGSWQQRKRKVKVERERDR